MSNSKIEQFLKDQSIQEMKERHHLRCDELLKNLFGNPSSYTDLETMFVKNETLCKMVEIMYEALTKIRSPKQINAVLNVSETITFINPDFVIDNAIQKCEGLLK